MQKYKNIQQMKMEVGFTVADLGMASNCFHHIVRYFGRSMFC